MKIEGGREASYRGWVRPLMMLPLSDPRWVENKKWRICKFFHTRKDLCVIVGRIIRRNNNIGFKVEPVDDANKEALRYSEQ
jgi:hypothetical protein